MKEIIGIVAALMAFVAYVPYLRGILRGKIKPHPYSWLIWSLTTIVILALQQTHGAGPGVYTTYTVAGIGFIISALGFRNGRKDITLLDTAFLIAALCATVVWIFADRPELSMMLLVGIDLLGMGPTVRKAWNKPHEELLFLWGANAARHGLSIAALQSYNLVTILNPLSWVISNTLFSVFLITRRRVVKRR